MKQRDYYNTYFKGLLGKLDELIYIKHLEECLMYGEHWPRSSSLLLFLMPIPQSISVQLNLDQIN